MNHKFIEAVSNTAFHLTLSKRQVQALAVVREGFKPALMEHIHGVATIHALHDRGLIEKRQVELESGGKAVGWAVTEEGELVCQLLAKANKLQLESLGAES